VSRQLVRQTVGQAPTSRASREVPYASLQSSRYEQHVWRFSALVAIVHQIYAGRAYAYIFVTTARAWRSSAGIAHWHSEHHTFSLLRHWGACVGLKVPAAGNLRTLSVNFLFHPSGVVELSSSEHWRSPAASALLAKRWKSRAGAGGKVLSRFEHGHRRAASAVVYHGISWPPSDSASTK